MFQINYHYYDAISDTALLVLVPNVIPNLYLCPENNNVQNK